MGYVGLKLGRQILYKQSGRLERYYCWVSLNWTTHSGCVGGRGGEHFHLIEDIRNSATQVCYDSVIFFLIYKTTLFQCSERIRRTKATNRDHVAGYRMLRRKRHQIQSQIMRVSRPNALRKTEEHQDCEHTLETKHVSSAHIPVPL